MFLLYILLRTNNTRKRKYDIGLFVILSIQCLSLIERLTMFRPKNTTNLFAFPSFHPSPCCSFVRRLHDKSFLNLRKNETLDSFIHSILCMFPAEPENSKRFVVLSPLQSLFGFGFGVGHKEPFSLKVLQS